MLGVKEAMKLMKLGPDKEENVEIEVEFEIDEKTYTNRLSL